MKIAIAVHGRFHGFDLARALIARDHDVRVFTNYPVWATRRFGVPGEKVRSFWPHGVAVKIVDRLGLTVGDALSAPMHKAFSKWVMRQINRESWDVVHAFSGVAEDVFLGTPKIPRHFLVRGSSHIRYQQRILHEESERTGVRLESPSDWIIEREEREYRMCDRLFVLSKFALRSFIEAGVPEAKMALLPLGVDARAFRPRRDVLVERARRIRSGAPLRVICAGTLCFRKGLYDLEKIVRGSDPARFHFQVIGSVAPEAKKFVAQLPARIEIVPRQPHAQLPSWYANADLFLLPTLEDGFAVVLTQACASGLPILATTNCAAPDFVRDGQNGWVLPIRDPEAFIGRLRWCDENREELAEMVYKTYDDFRPIDWDDVAANFESILHETAVTSRQ
ncbi:MAG TPA: glycosyltransferase family 4 protein [Bryobacteraceae bacterium]|jgi:glycosyltransferase involved in cell wall biosynthesis|nr:glycosyltransferase family 4 protein [Bryobacteraceae bacterium]